MKPQVYLLTLIFFLAVITGTQDGITDIKLAAREVIDLLPNESNYNRIRCLVVLKFLTKEHPEIISNVYTKFLVKEGDAALAMNICRERVWDSWVEGNAKDFPSAHRCFFWGCQSDTSRGSFINAIIQHPEYSEAFLELARYREKPFISYLIAHELEHLNSTKSREAMGFIGELYKVIPSILECKSEKESIEKLYCFGIKEVYSLKIPPNKIYLPTGWDTGLTIKAAIAGILYCRDEKDKALTLYKQTIEEEFTRLHVPIDEKKGYPKDFSYFWYFLHLQSMYGRMVEILVEQGQFDEALKLIEKGVKMFPKSARLYCINADIAIRQKDLAKARSLYEKAISVNPEYVPAYLFLSKLDLIENKETYELLDRCTTVIEFEGPESEWTRQALEIMFTRLKKDEGKKNKRYLAEAFGKIGPESVPGLIAALEDQDWRMRYYTMVMLGESDDIGPNAAGIVPALIGVLKDGGSDVIYHVAKALGKIGPEAKSATPALIASIKNITFRYFFVRHTIVNTLSRIGPEAIPELINALKDQNERIREVAVTVLGNIGEKKTLVVPLLINAFKDEDEDVRLAVVPALGKIGVEAVPPLIDILKGQDKDVIRYAVWALGEIGPKAEAAIPVLSELLKQESLREDSAETLGKIGEKALPALINALEDQDILIRESAAKGFGETGPEAISALSEVLKDKDWQIRVSAVKAIANIALHTVPVFSKDGKTSQEIPRGKVHPKVKADVVLALEKALKDENEAVRKAAEEAIKKFKSLGE